jgi:NTE family protein
MKALIISGGGAKGAFGGGMAEYFIKQANKQYDIFVGASTGSLLVPLLALGEIDSLKKAYTSIQQKDIFKICPFNIKKKQGKHQISINHLSA